MTSVSGHGGKDIDRKIEWIEPGVIDGFIDRPSLARRLPWRDVTTLGFG
jgi:hypothetical protein